MFFRSIKEVNRLISKGMSKLYLKVTIDKKRHSQNFNFLSLNFKTSCYNLKTRGLGAK